MCNSKQTPTNHAPTDDRHAPDKDPRVGLILDSKYKLIESLGQGGMGSVFRAQRLHIGDEVAVKLLHQDLVRENQALERFRREARTAAMIRHPNVVSIHDFNDGTGETSEAYIVMELVQGVSLGNLLRRDGRMPPERAVRLMQDICAGVGVAHRQGLLHRDLKPDNVIIVPPSHEGDEETAKVVDFGLAKVRDVTAQTALTQTGAVIGTLYYMSPEQCSGEELDARADVYSLGAMLYEMLTGGPPFRSNNFAGLISKHLHEPPPHFPDIPRSVRLRLSRCVCARWRRIVNQRQPDAIAFGRDLQRALEAPVSYQTFGFGYDTTFAVALDRCGSGSLCRADRDCRSRHRDSVWSESHAGESLTVAVECQPSARMLTRIANAKICAELGRALTVQWDTPRNSLSRIRTAIVLMECWNRHNSGRLQRHLRSAITHLDDEPD